MIARSSEVGRTAGLGRIQALRSCIAVLLLLESSACRVYDAELIEERVRRGDVRSGEATETDADVANGGSSDEAADASGTHCGDGVVEQGEHCDTAIDRGEPGACPDGCSGGQGCERNVYEGEDCQARCVVHLLTQRKPDDGCCPEGADHGSDIDCPSECGNGQVEPGESCDPPETCKKPENCQPADKCERALYSGEPEQCSSNCEVRRIESCENGDECCPTGCNLDSDDDCEPPAFDCAQSHAGEGASACQQCDCERCASEVEACVAGDYGERCEALIDCAEGARCVGPACYCGSVNPDSCESMQDGPCIDAVEEAGFNASPRLLLVGLGNTTYPLGRASALTTCRKEKCATECGL